MTIETHVALLERSATEHPGWSRMTVGGLAAGETLGLPGLAGTVVKSGFWRHAGGALPYARPESTEVLHVIDGEARIADPSGAAVTIAAGDTCIVRAGFVGEWTTTRPITKLSFSIIETALEEGTRD